MEAKEFEEKLKISTNTAIHCRTEELANQVLKVFHDKGLKWRVANSYLDTNSWEYSKDLTCYNPYEGGYCDYEFYNKNGFKIITADEFLELHKELPEEQQGANNNNCAKKYDEGKLRYDLIPPEFTEQVAIILTYGALKYGDNNWQGLDNFNDRYYAALERHLQAWRKGEENDQESGFSHLAHAATNCLFLLWKEIKNK